MRPNLMPDAKKKEEDHEIFKKKIEAYEVLRDKEKHTVCDMYGQDGLRGGGPPPEDTMLLEKLLVGLSTFNQGEEVLSALDILVDLLVVQQVQGTTIQATHLNPLHHSHSHKHPTSFKNHTAKLRSKVQVGWRQCSFGEWGGDASQFGGSKRHRRSSNVRERCSGRCRLDKLVK